MEERTQLGRRLYELGLRLGGLGTVAIGSGGGSLARALARTVGCGAALAGGEVRFHDGSCAACAAWLGQYYALPASVFIRQQGGAVTLWVLDGRGRLFSPPPRTCIPPPCTGSWDLLVGVDQSWAAHRAGETRQDGAVSIQGPVGLTLTLERIGYQVVPPASDIPLLRSDPEGFSLTLEYSGTTLPLAGEDAPAAAAAWLSQVRPLSALVPRPRLL